MEKKFTITTEYVFKIEREYANNDNNQFAILVTKDYKALFCIYISYPPKESNPSNSNAYYKYISQHNLRIHMNNHMILKFSDCSILKDIFNNAENMCKQLHTLCEKCI